MPKGFFTQTVCVLLDRIPSLDEVQEALSGFEIQGTRQSPGDWTLGGPTVFVSFRPEVNGTVTVDLVDRCWPDDMGDPQDDSMVFSAWSMGHFGPFTFPGGLQRATQQSWRWDAAGDTAARHTGFLRIQMTYILGAGDDAPVFPEDCNAMEELDFVSRIAVALLNVPGALCYFNPNGEVLSTAAILQDALEFAQEHGHPPLGIWTNIRLFHVCEGWSLMDTVGSQQLDIRDSEACFRPEYYVYEDVDQFLRNVSLYLLENGEIIADGDTMDGPGNVTWQARHSADSICTPPRRVLRWCPLDDVPLPEDFPEPTEESVDPGAPDE